jgi:hypothetical protein
LAFSFNMASFIRTYGPWNLTSGISVFSRISYV